MGSRSGARTDVYYFDDSTPNDPGGVWSNDANAFDNDETTSATTTTTGTVSSNYLEGIGTNAPASGGEIIEVRYRAYHGITAGSGDMNSQVRTTGWGEQLGGHSENASPSWENWQLLTEPSGGWTWSSVQNLEIRNWLLVTSSPTGASYAHQLRVTSTPTGQDDQGAVEARSRPIQETTTVDAGSNSHRFAGPGYHDWLIPVKASSTTVTVRGRYDSNHTGSLPLMEILNITGVADQSDVMVAAANTWETLTATFTPTADGVCRVRVRSRDTSADGEVFFDTLTVT
jgi:hypothetical protein